MCIYKANVVLKFVTNRPCVSNMQTQCDPSCVGVCIWSVSMVTINYQEISYQCTLPCRSEQYWKESGSFHGEILAQCWTCPSQMWSAKVHIHAVLEKKPEGRVKSVL